jgi:hypothetical protein
VVVFGGCDVVLDVCVVLDGVVEVVDEEDVVEDEDVVVLDVELMIDVEEVVEILEVSEVEVEMVELEAIVNCLCPSLTGCLKPGSTYAAATTLCGRGREDEASLFRVWERASDVLLAAACR